MRTLVLAALLVPLFTVSSSAQTTGVPGINDYVIGGFGSGSTSCTPLSFLGGGIVNFTVTGTGAGLPYFLFVASGPPGLTCCKTCVLPLVSSTCTIPNTTCIGSNQSIDLLPFSPCTLAPPIPGVLGAGGVGSMNLFVPPSVLFATQAAIFDPSCNSGSLPALLTQAYLIRT